MEAFTDKMIGYMSGGAIVGDDGTIWSTTPGFAASEKDFQQCNDVFNPNSPIIYNGLKFHGEIYSVNSVFDGIAKASTSSSGLIIAKCPTCSIVGHYEDPNNMKTCCQAIEKLQELITNNTSEKGVIRLDY